MSEHREHLEDQLKQAERKIDRLRMQLDQQASNAANAATSGAAHETALGADRHVRGGMLDRSMHPGMEMASAAEIGHIEALQRLADGRLAELNEARDERIQLRDEIDRLRMQLSYLPDERIMDTPLFQRVQESCNYYKADAEYQRAALETAQKELEELKASQRKFTEQIEVSRCMCLFMC
jgi:DNA repair exonuclease SbcCD ATPase subunit